MTDTQQQKKEQEEEENVSETSSSESSDSQDDMDEDVSVSENLSKETFTEEKKKPRQRKEREKTGIPRAKKPKPKRFGEGFGIIIQGLPEEEARAMRRQLEDEMKDRKKAGKTYYKPSFHDSESLFLGLTPEEEKKFALEYRAKYRMLPRVQKRRLEESEKEETKLKRQAYNKRPDIKAKKKILAKKRRKILREMKKNDPSGYKKAQRICDALFTVTPVIPQKDNGDGETATGSK
jgi:hypothetical protein